jgi:hypothetical protein
MMNDEEKTGSAEAWKRGRAEKAEEKRRRREEKTSFNLWTSVFYS